MWTFVSIHSVHAYRLPPTASLQYWSCGYPLRVVDTPLWIPSNTTLWIGAANDWAWRSHVPPPRLVSTLASTPPLSPTRDGDNGRALARLLWPNLHAHGHAALLPARMTKQRRYALVVALLQRPYVPS
jgi:hypothetical protein